MKKFTRTFLAASSLVAAVSFAAPAQAQLDHLNVGRLIKELREKGMSDLLVRLSKDGSIKDPADAKQLGVEMLILRAQTPVPGNVNDLKERIASLEQGMTEYQALINANRDNTKRGIWQTDMALHLIYTRMTMNDLADDFYEFGMPTQEQKQTFESGASLATESLIDAMVFLQKLQRDLPRAPEYNQTYVNTGRWEEMMDEYLKTKVPFLLATAAYWTTLLPDSHPYFASLGRNPKIPLQAATPAEERKRLLNLAVDSITNIPKELSEKYGLPGRPLNLTRGKALAHLGQYNDAMTALDLVTQAGRDDILGFRASLAKAVAMELKDKKPEAAVESLESLKDHPLCQGGVAFPILIADLQHRLLMKHAGKDKKKIEAAYMPYDSLLSDRDRLGNRIEAARMFVYTRWTKQYGEQGRDTLPPMVLSGMGEMERLLGNEKVALWAQYQKQEKPEEAKAAMTEGRVHLDKCIDICDALINQADTPPEVKARARYNKAYSSYLRDPESGQAFLDAARIWTELANDLPKHPLAEEAIGLAVRFLHNMHIREPRPDGVDAAYRNTTAVLFEKLGATHVADDERVYYTFNVLQAAGQFKEAAASYEKVPDQHKDYVEAQREWLYCQLQLWNQMPEGERGARAEFLRQEVSRIEKSARNALDDAGEPTRIQIFKNTLADLMIRKVEIDMYRKAWDEADRVLRNFADDYPDDPDLIRVAISKRIMVKVKQGASDDAVKLAMELMQAAGDDKEKQAGSASTIDAALAELADEIEDLRAAAEVAKGDLDRAAFTERATKQAEASDKLADMLLKWGLDNGADQDQLFRYRLIKARSSILTGKQESAATVLSPLVREFPDDPRVILLQGEVMFMTGKPAELTQSIRVFQKLTNDEGLRPTKITADLPIQERLRREVLNRLWWQAWLRSLQSYDKLNANLELIPRLVNQLESQYPDLGGPGLRSKFIQLRNKHSK